MTDSAKYGTARIVDRKEVSEALWTIRLATDFELTFHPGQYVTLGMEQSGRIVERPYSICSSPEEPEIELFIERVPGGELTTALHDLDIGAEIAVRRRCKGLFLRGSTEVTGHKMFIATVTGIAPFVSFIRTVLNRESQLPTTREDRVVVVHGGSAGDELAYSDELQTLSRSLDWLTYVPTVSRPWAEADWEGEVGRVDDVLRKYGDELNIRPGGSSVFLCGHPEMITNCRGIARRGGFDEGAIYEEQYWPE
jgi:ferredoxin/flavodoxin---NADP+ reductase